MKFDLHIHTRKSFDSFSSIRDIINHAKKRQLDGIALTDHDFLISDDLIDSEAHDNFWIIRGSEIQTEIGDIIGLFISKPLKSKQALSLINEIHDQGGIAILPHPFKRTNSYPVDILKKIDAIEIVNARWKDLRLIKNNPKVDQLLSVVKGRSAGSDTHFLFEVGKAYWETPHIKTHEELKRNICKGIGQAKCTSYSTWLDELSQCVKFFKNPTIKQSARIIYRLTRRAIYPSKTGLT